MYWCRYCGDFAVDQMVCADKSCQDEDMQSLLKIGSDSGVEGYTYSTTATFASGASMTVNTTVEWNMS